MKLIIRRDQKPQTGLFGGHKGMAFLLSCHVELTSEEQALITKYKAGREQLTLLPLVEGEALFPICIGTLLEGYNYEGKDVTSLLAIEDEIKKACEGFKTLLAVMASFGGEEIIEF